MDCKNCGNRYTDKWKRRWWCALCGYWADRRKPAV